MFSPARATFRLNERLLRPFGIALALVFAYAACSDDAGGPSGGAPGSEHIESGGYGDLVVTIENETTARLEWAYEIEPDAFSIAVLSEDGSITDVGEAGGDERVASVEYEACGGVFLYRVTALSDGREYPVAKSGPVDVCDMIRIPEGTAWVGCDPAVDAFCRDDEMPVHEAWITQFWMDRTEVSFEKYAECSLAGTCVATALAPSDVGAADDAPVLGVNWSMARDYCIGRGKRLPTEAEWEKAGRGTTARVYPWGNDWNPGYANWDDDGLYDGFDSPSPVSSFSHTPSPYGVLNLSGNVWEWVSDFYAPDYYAASGAVDPEGPESGDRRVTKGGAWRYDFFETRLRLAYRNPEPESGASDHVGFRCVRN